MSTARKANDVGLGRVTKDNAHPVENEDDKGHVIVIATPSQEDLPCKCRVPHGFALGRPWMILDPDGSYRVPGRRDLVVMWSWARLWTRLLYRLRQLNVMWRRLCQRF